MRVQDVLNQKPHICAGVLDPERTKVVKRILQTQTTKRDMIIVCCSCAETIEAYTKYKVRGIQVKMAVCQSLDDIERAWNIHLFPFSTAESGQYSKTITFVIEDNLVCRNLINSGVMREMMSEHKRFNATIVLTLSPHLLRQEILRSSIKLLFLYKGQCTAEFESLLKEWPSTPYVHLRL